MINIIASNTFGVYLIHTNRIVSEYVLPHIFPIYLVTNPFWVFVYSIGSVVTVYVVSTLLDMLRQRTVEKLWIKLLDAKLVSFEKFAKYIFRKGKRKVLGFAKDYYG